jgi:hypothetical protein
MVRGLRTTRLAATLVGMLLVGSEASARNEQLTWMHTDPSTVNGFRVYWRTSGSSTQNQVNAGLPAQSGNSFTFTVANIPDTSDVYFSVRAFNTGGDSPSSNEICRGPGVPCGTTTTPPPPPPPPTGGTQASITGFKVWNASTDTVLIDDFQNGATISASCAAIEIVGNSYLVTGNGSVRKSFDNVVGACENTSPFGYPDGGAVGQFDCEAALTNGSHSVSVTTYDGKDCTGTAGAAAIRSFSVSVGGSTTPPPPAALGTPGKPYLVQ